MTLHILRIIMTVDPRYGGPVEAVRNSTLELQRHGHTTEVLTLDDPNADFLADFPAPVHAIKPLVRRYGYTAKLGRWIRRNAHRFDVAVIEGVWNHSSVGGWWSLRSVDLPYVVFTHGMLDPWFRLHYPFKHYLKQLFWSLAQGKVLRDAQSVLFTCEEERLLARSAFKGPAYREKVVSFGTADAPKISPAQSAAFYRYVPQAQGRRYLLFLSRIHPKKGLDVLIRAFARVSDTCPDLDLVIAGPDSGGLSAQLQALSMELGVAPRIIWAGMLVGDAKWGAFREADAFILSSHSENFGIVVAESLACGTPVLISDKVNIWREVDAGGAGFVEEDTVEGTELLLRRWIACDTNDRKAMSRNATKCFTERFHISSATHSLIAVLESVQRKSA